MRDNENGWCAARIRIASCAVAKTVVASAANVAATATSFFLAAQLTMLACAQSPQAPSQAAAALPDIVFILSDDQAYNDYSFMGHEHIRTPNLDRLARESRLFTRGYVPDSLCRPSLAAIISGRYPHQHGIVGNDPPPAQRTAQTRQRQYTNPAYQAQIEKFLQLHIDRMTTLPDRLQPLGYVSFQTGKWWEGNFSRGGFQHGMTHGDHNRGARHGDVGLEIGRKGMKQIEQYVQQARRSGQPYFLWYAPMLPHTPHDPPERLLSRLRALAPSEPIAKYWAMCERFDETIGELREIIATQGRPDNTLIVYVTDNGWINLPDKSAFAPRSKRSPHEGGIRTPIFFHWTGHIQPARDETHLVSSIDLVPTTMALLGQPRTDDLPGINVLDAAALEKRGAIFGEIFDHDIADMEDAAASLEYRWVIDGFDKLIVPAARKVGASDRQRAGQVPSALELYDLRADPNEMHNLAEGSDQQDKIKRLRSQLDQWWAGD